MSLTLLSTTLLNRLRLRVRSFLPSPLPPEVRPETPRQQRKRLRDEVLARGGVLGQIETIEGDCPAQTAQQIRDLTEWLEKHRATIPAA